MGKPPYKAIRACAAVSFLEYGGLKPILPFLGGRSDAACRVVIQMPPASRPFPYRHYAPTLPPPISLPPSPPLPILPPSPYMRRTIVAAPSDFTAKSEGAAALVLRMYGDGTEVYGGLG